MKEIIKRQSKIHNKSIEMMSIVVMSKLVLQSTNKGISPQNNGNSMIPSESRNQRSICIITMDTHFCNQSMITFNHTECGNGVIPHRVIHIESLFLIYDRYLNRITH